MPRQAPGGFMPGAWPPAPAGTPERRFNTRAALSRLSSGLLLQPLTGCSCRAALVSDYLSFEKSPEPSLCLEKTGVDG